MSHHQFINNDRLLRFKNVQSALGDTMWPEDPDDSRPPLLFVFFEEDGSGWLDSFLERDLDKAISIVKEVLLPIAIWRKALTGIVTDAGSQVITEIWLHRFRESMSAPSEENIMLWNQHVNEFEKEVVSVVINNQLDVMRFEENRLTRLLAELENLKETA